MINITKNIPKEIHFIFGMSPNFGGIPFSYVHYISITSARLVLKPDRINVFYAFEPSGYWWKKILPFITPIKIDPKEEVWGHKLNHYAHRADVLRLEILYERGGIYLDLDVIVMKSFDEFLEFELVMGEEGYKPRKGLCNAVILAKPEARFLRRWLCEYKDFTDIKWNQFSVKTPYKLSLMYPEEIHVLGYKKFFWPMWFEEDLKMLFSDSDLDLSENYTLHLWQHGSYEKYLKDLNPNYVISVETVFNKIVRRFLDNTFI